MSDAFQQMEQICIELESMYNTGLFHYKKSIELQEVDKQHSEIYFYTSQCLFFYMVIRFCAFYDAYKYGYQEKPTNVSHEPICKLFKDIDVEAKKALRDIILAHNYNKKIGKGNYINDLPKALSGEYNGYIGGSPTDFESMYITSRKIISELQSISQS